MTIDSVRSVYLFSYLNALLNEKLYMYECMI